MPYYNRDPKRDHTFDNHPDKAELMILHKPKDQSDMIKGGVAGTSGSHWECLKARESIVNRWKVGTQGIFRFWLLHSNVASAALVL